MAHVTATARIAGILILSASIATVSAQTAVKPPKNKYTPEQDVKLGREAAAEVRTQYPVIDDQRIVKYLAVLGDRLVTAAPAGVETPGLRVFVYARESQGDQRVRAARRADVR